MVESASFSEYTVRSFVNCWLPLPACYNLQIDEYAGGSLFRRNVATGVTIRAMVLVLFSLPDYTCSPPSCCCRLFSRHPLCRCALETLERLSESLDLTDLASRIVHPIVRSLDATPELRNPAMDTLCALVYQLGKRYSTFIPTVNKVLY